MYGFGALCCHSHGTEMKWTYGSSKADAVHYVYAEIHASKRATVAIIC